MFHQPPSLALSWNLIKEKKENLSVWKSKVTSPARALVFVSHTRSTKGFAGPEAARSISRANSKTHDGAANQNPQQCSHTWNSPASRFTCPVHLSLQKPLLLLCPTKGASVCSAAGQLMFVKCAVLCRWLREKLCLPIIHTHSTRGIM